MSYSVDLPYYEAALARAEAIEAAKPHAEESLCSNVEAFSEWLMGQVGTPRAASAFFWQISLQELQAMLFNPWAKPEQIVAARDEIRRRYLSDNKDAVQRIAREMCDA